MTAREIAGEIRKGNFSVSELKEINDSLTIAREVTTRNAINDLRIGQRGRLSGLRPKKYNGRLVEVVNLKQTRVEVVDVGTNSAFSAPYTVPAQCFIPEA